MARLLEDFRQVNPLKRLNRWAQMLLALTFILGLNWLALRHHARISLAEGDRYALAPETKAFLRELRASIQISVLLTPSWTDNTTGEGSGNTSSVAPVNDSLLRDVRRLTREYELAVSGGGSQRIDVEFVDLFQHVARAAELRRLYSLSDPNVVVVASGNRWRVLSPEEFVIQGADQPIAFTGERALTSAILEVTDDRPLRLYAVTGHGEMQLGSVDPERGLSEFASELRQRNLQMQELDLAKVAEVPADADVVLLAGPTGPLLAHEVEKLRAYLTERRGRLAIFLEPGVDARLDDLLFDWGVLSDDALVLERHPDALTATGEMIVRRVADHPVTRTLHLRQIPLFFPFARPVRADPGAAPDERLAVTTLLQSTDLSWAEFNYLSRSGEPIAYDAAVDLRGPVSLAVVAERRVRDRLGINLSAGRLLVVGNAALLSNGRLSNVGHLMFGLNSIQWLLDRERTLPIAARPAQRLLLPFSTAELNRLGLIFLILPGAIAFVGLVVWWVRRR